MAAIDLNDVRKTIESRLLTELEDTPPVKVIFNDIPFSSSSKDSFVQCITSFSEGNYLTMGGTTNSTNRIVGLLILNIFTEAGKGSGANFTIGKRLRNLYNRITVSNVIFDSPIGPEVLTSSPEGKFQTQLRITFEIYEEL
tara:strand:+ start:1975 stop:2397 length:423 start_codon:yes stop_codon:yes gene_type:complete